MKKFLAIVLALCAMMSLNLVAFAESNETDEPESVMVSLEVIIDDWIEANYQGNVSVSRVLKLYDPDKNSGEFVGHLVTFEKDGMPSGYIVLSREEDDYPIVEFALGGESVYDRIKEQVAVSFNSKLVDCDNSIDSHDKPFYTIETEDILYTNFINYSLAVKEDDNVVLINQYNQVYDFPESIHNMYVSPCSKGMDDGYVWTRYPDESVILNEDAIPGGLDECGLVMGYFASNEGNCAPTCLTNLVNLYYNYALNGGNRLWGLLYRGNIDDTYKELARQCGYTGSGSVSNDKMISALEQYCYERGYRGYANKYWLNLWGDFTRDVEKDMPIFLHTGAANGDGHAQVIVGYRQYNNGNKYLMAYTGWTEYASFIKFKASCFTEFQGWNIEIIKKD